MNGGERTVMEIAAMYNIYSIKNSTCEPSKLPHIYNINDIVTLTCIMISVKTPIYMMLLPP